MKNTTYLHSTLDGEGLANWRDRDVLTAAEFSTLMRMALSNVYRMCRDGSIPAIRIDGTVRIPVTYVRSLFGEEA